eukprot:s980_g5.t1
MEIRCCTGNHAALAKWYRTASRLFPGSQLPWLFIGMEYVRTNSLQLAQQCLDCARTLMPTDPRVYNETLGTRFVIRDALVLGVVAYQKRNYEEAVHLLRQAIRLSNHPQEAMHCNLGHALLKCGRPAAALEAFHQAVRLEPSGSKALAGVAFALQLQVVLGGEWKQDVDGSGHNSQR